MARIYEQQDRTPTGAIPLPSHLRVDPVSRHAIWKYWLSIAALAVAALAFHVYARLAHLSPVAVVVAYALTAAVILLLFQVRRSFLAVHTESQADLEADRLVEQHLSQLDDRFAVFTRVRAGDAWIDHVIVGPSGVFALYNSPASGRRERKFRTGLDRARAAASELHRLLRQIAPESDPVVEPVLTVPDDAPVTVERDGDVWVVAAGKIVPALLKRSTQPGAIGHDVEVTGAFSTSALVNTPVENALVHHLDVTLRKTLKHYQPPPEMTNPPSHAAGHKPDARA